MYSNISCCCKYNFTNTHYHKGISCELKKKPMSVHNAEILSNTIERRFNIGIIMLEDLCAFRSLDFVRHR